MSFLFSCIVRLALFWTSWIRLFLSGIVMFCMLPHTSRMLMLSGFSGHVHVCQVYVFGLIPMCTMRCVTLEYCLWHYGQSIEYLDMAPSLLCVPLPSVLLGFPGYYWFSRIVASCVAIPAVLCSILQSSLIPILFRSCSHVSCFGLSCRIWGVLLVLALRFQALAVGFGLGEVFLFAAMAHVR